MKYIFTNMVTEAHFIDSRSCSIVILEVATQRSRREDAGMSCGFWGGIPAANAKRAIKGRASSAVERKKSSSSVSLPSAIQIELDT